MWINKGLCKLCLIYSRTKDLINLGKEDMIPNMLRKLAEVTENYQSRTLSFVETFEYIKKITSTPDPYYRLKLELKTIGRNLAFEIERYLSSINWDIKEALRISAAANILDTTVLGFEPKELREAIWDKPAIEDFINIPKDSTIYLVLDNAGEAEIDILLAKALKKHGYKVIITVRRDSYEIDVTRNDIDEEFEVFETPSSISPIKYLSNGFIIAKGIANAEAYIEFGKQPSIHLLRAKCDVIAQAFNVKKNSILIVSGDTIKNKLRII